jgi:catechol 2,3-dioxygenase-like lactoylglutathione lyase family enzyme
VFDHVSLNVRDFAASREFYTRALEPLGINERIAFEEWNSCGFGVFEKPQDFWITQREPFGTGIHVAFAADDRATVDAFHAAALDAGGTDNGAPGIRDHYHSNYYGAFVLDPDGNNVEAVCHNG